MNLFKRKKFYIPKKYLTIYRSMGPTERGYYKIGG